MPADDGCEGSSSSDREHTEHVATSLRSRTRRSRWSGRGRRLVAGAFIGSLFCLEGRVEFEQFEQFDEGDGCSGAIDLHAVRLAASRPTVQRCVPRSVPRTCSGERLTNHRFDGRGDLARLLRTGGLVAAEAARMGRATKRMFPGVGPRLRYLWATCRSSAPVNITVAKTRSEARSKGERSGWSLGIGEQYA